MRYGPKGRVCALGVLMEGPIREGRLLEGIGWRIFTPGEAQHLTTSAGGALTTEQARTWLRVRWANSLAGRRIHMPGGGSRLHRITHVMVGARGTGVWVYAGRRREFVPWPDRRWPKRSLRPL